LPVEMLATADDRRPVSVAEHAAFQRAISRPTDRFDEIDAELDELTVIDPYVSGTNNRRSDKELARVLALLDSLGTGKEGSY